MIAITVLRRSSGFNHVLLLVLQEESLPLADHRLVQQLKGSYGLKQGLDVEFIIQMVLSFLKEMLSLEHLALCLCAP